MTAAIRANHWIDDLSIDTTLVSGAFILSALPLAQGALPDAIVKVEIQDLGGAAVSLSFDGGPASTPQTTTSGNVTTVTYDPPGLLPSGSSHTVKLTYGAKTLNFGFNVVNYVPLTSADALDASAVDTAKPGFKLKVYQSETNVISNNRTAEKVLAGLAGANIGAPSGTADGLFEVAGVINFDKDGAEAGNIGGDTAFPGMPGTRSDGSPSTDNFAVEVIAFLDLPVGAYNFGVNSDDGFKLAAASNPRDVAGMQIAVFDATRVPAESVGDFAVTQAGIYPFRLVYWQQGAGADLEWYAIDAGGNRTLINDPNAAAGKRIKSYRQLNANSTPTRPCRLT